MVYLPMQKSNEKEIEVLKAQCSALEEQVILLVKTELTLRRTQAELIQSKEQIEEYNRTLEQKVEERTRELLQSNEKLKIEMIEREKTEEENKKLQESLSRAAKMEAVGILAGSVAHDLNNILNGIIGYPELLLRKVPEDSPLREWIIAIQECGEKAAAVVQDIVLLARRGVIVQDLVNVNTIILKTINSPEFLKVCREHPAVLVKINLQPFLLNIFGSSIHIYTAIINILINAFEAMEHGGQLSISTENVTFDKPKAGYELIETGDYVLIKISDAGVGISKKDINRIFEPFYTRKKMGKSGTGLGLAIVWGTIKDHKGFIDLESEEGAGTTFTLYLPSTREIKMENGKDLKPDDYKGNNESILIIDDYKIQRDICTQFLTELGYCATSVSSGEEAIQYLRGHKVDLLVLDMVMDPGIDGLETYKRIIEIHPAQKAIITSGYAETTLVEEAQLLGAGPYLKKPYTLEQIGSMIKKTLPTTRQMQRD
jgi:two-component system, cell cycle sensor histidine kinase and response regulator CckA